MPSRQRPTTLDNAAAALEARVSVQLRELFENLAKQCLQASAEFSADTDLTVFDKARKAHSAVTLLIDDAMRGLADVQESLIEGAMAITALASTAEESGKK